MVGTDSAVGRAREWLDGARGPLLGACLGAATVLFVLQVDRHYRVEDWLVFPYLACWGYTFFFALACFLSGARTLRWLRVERGSPGSHFVLSFACGVYLFFLGMFLTGVCGLYGASLFWMLPIFLIALGIQSEGVPLWNALRARRTAPGTCTNWHRSPLTPIVMAATIAGCALVYIPILTPHNIAYDARWYHLPIAEHYVAEGGIHPFVEGWYQGTYPQLASLLYTWAFLAPRGDLFLHLELAAHLEFALFLATLVGVAELVRWCTHGKAFAGGIAVMFLFPGLFLYDSSLSVAADHIAAFWGPPILLAWIGALRSSSARSAIVFACMLAGAMMTKYQGQMLLAFPAVTFAGAAVLRTRYGRHRALLPLGTCLVAGAIFTAPHWLKNFLFYGDPLYPFLNKVFAGRPWTPKSPYFFDVYLKTQMWSAHGNPFERLKKGAEVFFTFSFVPNDWPVFHGVVPVFGSLFTLLIVCLPLLRRTGRIWALVGGTFVGMCLWYNASHQDRYLQILLPWMAAAVGGILTLVWEQGKIARIGATWLVGVQLLWGLDVPTFPTHGLVGSPWKSVLDLASSGYRKDFAARRLLFGPIQEIGEALPAKARVLLHAMHVHLGLGHASVSDAVVWQGGISYPDRLHTPSIVQLMKGYGVTHVVWTTNSAGTDDSYAGELLFFRFVKRGTTHEQSVGNLTVAELRVDNQVREEAAASDRVALLRCRDSIVRFVEVDALATAFHDTEVRQVFDATGIAATWSPQMDLDFLLVEKGCAPDATTKGFESAATREGLEFWVRRGPS